VLIVLEASPRAVRHVRIVKPPPPEQPDELDAT
jgi:hypothetical protein